MPGADHRITKQTEQILEVLTRDPTAELSGSEIAPTTQLGKGTIYPALLRMERFGWLTWRWEDIEPAIEGRPRKRLYKLTGEGERAAHDIAHQAERRQRERERKQLYPNPSPRGLTA